jgi:hypothetical protein
MTKPEIPKEMSSDERQIKILQKFLDMSEAASAWQTNFIHLYDYLEYDDTRREAFLAGATWAKSQAASEVEAAETRGYEQGVRAATSIEKMTAYESEAVECAVKAERERITWAYKHWANDVGNEEPFDFLGVVNLSRPSREGEDNG